MESIEALSGKKTTRARAIQHGDGECWRMASRLPFPSSPRVRINTDGLVVGLYPLFAHQKPWGHLQISVNPSSDHHGQRFAW